MVVRAATQTHISLFFLRFLSSLAQLMLKNRLVPAYSSILLSSYQN